MQSITQQFIGWLETKPADETYEYCDHRGCALYQFLAAAGYPVRSVSHSDWTDQDRVTHELPHVLRGVTGGGPGLLNDLPWAFGALRERLTASAREREPA